MTADFPKQANIIFDPLTTKLSSVYTPALYTAATRRVEYSGSTARWIHGYPEHCIQRLNCVLNTAAPLRVDSCSDQFVRLVRMKKPHPHGKHRVTFQHSFECIVVDMNIVLVIHPGLVARLGLLVPETKMRRLLFILPDQSCQRATVQYIYVPIPFGKEPALQTFAIDNDAMMSRMVVISIAVCCAHSNTSSSPIFCKITLRTICSLSKCPILRLRWKSPASLENDLRDYIVVMSHANIAYRFYQLLRAIFVVSPTLVTERLSLQLLDSGMYFLFARIVPTTWIAPKHNIIIWIISFTTCNGLYWQ